MNANAVVNRYLPGLLADVCGVEVDEYDVQPARYRPSRLNWPCPAASPQSAQARLWFDVLRHNHCTTHRNVPERIIFPAARPLPSTVLERARRSTWERLGMMLCMTLWWTGHWKSIDLHPAFHAPSGVEATARWQGDQRLLFLLNHTGETREMPITQPYLDLLTETTVNGIVHLPPYGVFLLQQQAECMAYGLKRYVDG